eukprot:Skav225590  [mRNA]  locus=scaffold901:130854:134429:+ [translate_table: standard]
MDSLKTGSAQEDEDLARAVALQRFRYGVDYPKPMIQPVSLMNTEQAEDEARQHQSRRDSQIAASKRQKGSPSAAAQVTLVFLAHRSAQKAESDEQRGGRRWGNRAMGA